MSDVDTTREHLASIEHGRWADWQNWVHKVYLEGNFKEFMLRWQRQINTPWAGLSEGEKAKDMEQVDRYWPIILDLMAQARAQALDDLLEAMPEKYEQRTIRARDGHLMCNTCGSDVFGGICACHRINDILGDITATIHQLKSSKKGADDE